MYLVRLIYVSKFSPGIGTDDINDILRASRANNPEMKITGMLCYAPGVFLQCLEGPREAVNKLYRAIAADDRHQNATVLEYADVDDRTFGKWSMAYIRAEDLGELPELVPSANEKFDPFAMTAGEAFEFVSAIAKKREDLLESSMKDMEAQSR